MISSCLQSNHMPPNYGDLAIMLLRVLWWIFHIIVDSAISLLELSSTCIHLKWSSMHHLISLLRLWFDEFPRWFYHQLKKITFDLHQGFELFNLFIIVPSGFIQFFLYPLVFFIIGVYFLLIVIHVLVDPNISFLNHR